MTDMRTEEEQIEAIKNWWQENGKQTIIALVVVAGGWFGYQGYQGQQIETGEAASAIYQNVLTLQASDAEEDKGKVQLLLDQLQTEYASTVYADFAGLIKAKQAVEAGDLAAAATELETVKANTSDDATRHLATLRLARVYVSLEKLDLALALVEPKDAGAFSAQYSEIKGDALFAQGDKAGARDAYALAMSQGQAVDANNPVLKMKLDDLAVAN